MEGSGLDTMEGEKGYPWVEQRKKRRQKKKEYAYQKFYTN
ncbi:hypothetical protein HSISS2_402 [Streptococcus sp. HSISS2]|nr:hypothetical protein HSISS2_402 [Streptococcus sp. HSISS2]